jgi:hypothetical protein
MAFLALVSVVDLEAWLGYPPPPPGALDLNFLHSPWFPLGFLLDGPIHSLYQGMFGAFLIFLLRILLRKQWLAAAAFVIIGSIPDASQAEYPLLVLPFTLLFAGAVFFLFLRFGLLAVVATLACLGYSTLIATTDFSSWAATPTLLGLAGILAWTIYGFVVSLGGRPLFGSAGFLEERET